MTIADTLRASRAAHQAALSARQRKDAVSAEAQLRDAYRLRLEAARDDPDRTDPAWIEDQDVTPRGRDTHADLLAFYALKIPVPPSLTDKETTDAERATDRTADVQPAAEPAAQPRESEPVAAGAAVAESAHPAGPTTTEPPARARRPAAPRVTVTRKPKTKARARHG